MKNKFINIFLVLIFNIISFNFTVAEEFNFNITELQVTENGNLITGIKGGMVTSRNNEIIITAENFKYNKLTTLLEAEGNVKLIDKIADVVVESNEIFYLKDKEKIYTLGKTNINVQNKYDINGHDFIFLRNKMILSTNKDSIITDNYSNVYELKKFQYLVNEEIF